MATTTATRPRRARTLRARTAPALRCIFCSRTATPDEAGLDWLALAVDGSGLRCLVCPACALEQAALRGEA